MRSVSKLLPVLGDTGLGLIAASIVISFFGGPYTPLFVIWVVLWNYLPDLDGAIHFVRTGYLVADREEGRDHREGLHYPLAWFLMLGIFIYAYGLNPWLAGSLLAIIFHFAHDTVGVGWGVQLFMPFDKGSYRLFSKKWVSADISLHPLVTRYSPDELKKAIKELGESDWIEKYFCKLTLVSIIDYSLFALGVVTICFVFFA